MELKVVRLKRLLRLIGRVADEESTRAYLVGGSLRDTILKKRVIDLDIAVEDKVKTIGRRLSQMLGGEFVFYRDFNTGVTTRKSGLRIDLAQTRNEVYLRPAMLPKVISSDIISDLRRRDFTINAMALDLSNHRFGQLIDPHGGYNDLKRGLIRILHPRSFIDDPTRIFRALRFASRLGFKLDHKTKRLMQDAIRKRFIPRLSGERILHELELVLNEPQRQVILKRLKGVLAQLGFRLPNDFFNNLSKLEDPRFLLIYLFSFLDDLVKYPLKRETVKTIESLRDFRKVERALMKAKRPSEIYRLLNGLSADALIILKAIKGPAISQRIARYLNRYAKTKIGIRGGDLKRLGIPPGAIYKKIFNELLYARLDGRIRGRAGERCYLKKLVGGLC